MSYYNHNSSLFDPKPVRDYVSHDGMFAIIPCGNKWMLIVNGDQMGVSSSFEIAMRRLEKLKNTHSKSKKRTKTPAKPKSKKIQNKHLLHPSGGKGSQGRGGQSKQVDTNSANPLLNALS